MNIERADFERLWKRAVAISLLAGDTVKPRFSPQWTGNWFEILRAISACDCRVCPRFIEEARKEGYIV